MSVGILGQQPRCTLGLAAIVQSPPPPFVSDEVIPWDTIIADSANMADLATSSIIVQRDGLYLIDISAEVAAVDAGNLPTLDEAIVYLAVGGGNVRILAQPIWGTRTIGVGTGRLYAEWHGVGVFACLAGDVLIAGYNLGDIGAGADHIAVSSARFDVVRLSS